MSGSKVSFWSGLPILLILALIFFTAYYYFAQDSMRETVKNTLDIEHAPTAYELAIARKQAQLSNLKYPEGLWVYKISGFSYDSAISLFFSKNKKITITISSKLYGRIYRRTLTGDLKFIKGHVIYLKNIHGAKGLLSTNYSISVSQPNKNTLIIYGDQKDRPKNVFNRKY